MESWEPPACEVWSNCFPSNYNRINGGGITGDHWGELAGPPEGRRIQVCVEQARLLIQVPCSLRLLLLYWPLGVSFHQWGHVGGHRAEGQIWVVVQAGEGAAPVGDV